MQKFCWLPVTQKCKNMIYSGVEGTALVPMGLNQNQRDFQQIKEMDTICIITENQLAIDLLSVNTIHTKVFPGFLKEKESVISRWTTIRNNDWGENLCFSTRKNESHYFLFWTQFQLANDNKIFLGFWRLTKDTWIPNSRSPFRNCSIYFPSKQWCK